MPAVTFTTGGALNKSALREANERLVLNAIRQNPSASRSDLARITGLSRSSVTFIVNRLVRKKVICEEEVENRAQVGRRPTPLRLRADAMLAVGVEVGLSSARVALADLTGKLSRQKTVEWHPNPELYLEKIHAAIRAIIEPFSPRQILGAGVGLPGFLDRATGKVIAAENFNWFGVEAGNLLRKRLTCPFHFENAARLSALAEMWFAGGNGRPPRDFVFVTARDGLGTGVMINGQILRGASSGAAEFGHTTLYVNGRQCGCGNSGCWEQYASDLALRRRYREAGGGEADAGEITGKAREGDPVALRVLRETAHDAAMGFVNLIMALNPEAIILGDFLAEGWELVQDVVWAEVRKRVPAYYLAGVRILPSRHALDSSLLGAAALVFAQFFTSFDQENGNLASSAVMMRHSG